MRIAATYYAMVIVYIGGVFGSGSLIAIQGLATSTCEPGENPDSSLGSLRVTIGVLTALLVLYCLGCAGYLRRRDFGTLHVALWVTAGTVTLAVGSYGLAAAGVAHYCF